MMDVVCCRGAFPPGRLDGEVDPREGAWRAERTPRMQDEACPSVARCPRYSGAKPKMSVSGGQAWANERKLVMREWFAWRVEVDRLET